MADDPVAATWLESPPPPQAQSPPLKQRGTAGEPDAGAVDGPPVLTLIASSSYSVGHFLNDATASCWFSYLLLYLTQAQGE